MAKLHGNPLLAALSVLFFLYYNHHQASAAFNVVALGADPAGKTDSSKAFLSAWNSACKSTAPTSIYVPSGRFLLGNPLKFNGPCMNNAIAFRIEGTLVAPSDYKAMANLASWVSFQYVDGVLISGGVLDGQGSGLWGCKSSDSNICPTSLGATTLLFSNSKNIVVSRLTSLNSQMFHIVINGCQNVKLQTVKISAPGDSPNTDGIHVQLSSNVTILNSNVATGDDCVSIGPGTSNLWIEKMSCGPGHGISIGSLGKDMEEEGVMNVTITRAVFKGTQNGVRIKSWGRPSTGFARNIRFEHVVMSNVQNPIIIDQNYCPNNENCPGQDSGVTISGVTYRDIHGTSATRVALNFDCSTKNRCTGIQLEDVKLTYKDQLAEASCINADGTASGLVQATSCF